MNYTNGEKKTESLSERKPGLGGGFALIRSKLEFRWVDRRDSIPRTN